MSAARAAFGVAMIARPERVAEAWIGEPGHSVRVGVLARSIGARDIAMGGGAAVALFRGDDDAARAFLAGQAFSDLTDLGATLVAREKLPESGVKTTAILAGVSAVVSAAAAALLNE